MEKISKQISEQLLESLLYGRSARFIDWERYSLFNKPEQLVIEIVCEETGEGFELVKVVEREGKFRLVVKRESNSE